MKILLCLLITCLIASNSFALKDFNVVNNDIKTSKDNTKLTKDIFSAKGNKIVETFEVCQDGYVFVVAVSLVGSVAIYQKEIELSDKRILQKCTTITNEK